MSSPIRCTGPIARARPRPMGRAKGTGPSTATAADLDRVELEGFRWSKLEEAGLYTALAGGTPAPIGNCLAGPLRDGLRGRIQALLDSGVEIVAKRRFRLPLIMAEHRPLSAAQALDYLAAQPPMLFHEPLFVRSRGSKPYPLERIGDLEALDAIHLRDGLERSTLTGRAAQTAELLRTLGRLGFQFEQKRWTERQPEPIDALGVYNFVNVRHYPPQVESVSLRRGDFLLHHGSKPEELLQLACFVERAGRAGVGPESLTEGLERLHRDEHWVRWYDPLLSTSRGEPQVLVQRGYGHAFPVPLRRLGDAAYVEARVARCEQLLESLQARLPYGYGDCMAQWLSLAHSEFPALKPERAAGYLATLWASEAGTVSHPVAALHRAAELLSRLQDDFSGPELDSVVQDCSRLGCWDREERVRWLQYLHRELPRSVEGETLCRLRETFVDLSECAGYGPVARTAWDWCCRAAGLETPGGEAEYLWGCQVSADRQADVGRCLLALTGPMRRLGRLQELPRAFPGLLRFMEQERVAPDEAARRLIEYFVLAQPQSWEPDGLAQALRALGADGPRTGIRVGEGEVEVGGVRLPVRGERTRPSGAGADTPGSNEDPA
ncbi:MAG: hypothetical protein HY319_19660 [Armatimonadetes bacterium]|nr:hypothetical protein [Armatimonadota bacterium]